jgi:hypothetical protein
MTAKSPNPIDHHSLPWGCWFVPATFVLMMVASTYWGGQVSNDYSAPPSGRPDEVFNDNLAINLAADGDFELRFSDADWLQAYAGNNLNGQLDWIYNVSAEGKTTAIAPAYPYLLSRTYAFSSRRWEAIRSYSAILLAIALTLLVTQIACHFGLPAGILAIATIVLDSTLHQSAFYIGSESLSASVLIFFFCAVIHAWHSKTEQVRRSWRWPVAGALLGTLALCHWQANYWILAITVGLVVALVKLLVTRGDSAKFLQCAALFLAGTFVIAAPWWVRNCRVAGEFLPLGRGVPIGLVGGYSDAALSTGNWNFDQIVKCQEEVQTAEQVVTGLISQERLVAEKSLEKTNQWIEDNPSKLFPLATAKIVSHFELNKLDGFVSILNIVLLVGGGLGMVLTWRSYGGFIACVFALSVVTVALTWAENGRHFVPIKPLMHAALAAAIGSLVVKARAKRTPESV